MPPATQLRNHTMTYKDIVKKVLQLRPQINCKRPDILSIPSMMVAEYDHELDQQVDFKEKMRQNIQQENSR